MSKGSGIYSAPMTYVMMQQFLTAIARCSVLAVQTTIAIHRIQTTELLPAATCSELFGSLVKPGA
jgi:hypothetical protein